MNARNIKGFTIHQSGDVIRIRQKANVFLRVFLVGFMCVWLFGWTIAMGHMAIGLINKFTLIKLLGTIPFFAAWFGVVAFMLTVLLPAPTVFLDKSELRTRDSRWFPFLGKRIEFKEIFAFRIKADGDRNHTLVVESSGKDEILFHGDNKNALKKVRELLCERIPPLHPPNTKGSTKSSRASTARSRIARPRETGWQVESGLAGETRLINLGSIEWRTSLISLGLCLVWNAIVAAVLVRAIIHLMLNDPRWFEFAFLAPFALIGLGILGFTLVCWLDPFRRIEYTFSNSEVSREFTYFGFGPSETWNATGPVAVTILRDKNLGELANGDDFELSFATKREARKKTINPLTLAEAEWIATELEKRQGYRVNRTIEDWTV